MKGWFWAIFEAFISVTKMVVFLLGVITATVIVIVFASVSEPTKLGDNAPDKVVIMSDGRMLAEFRNPSAFWKWAESHKNMHVISVSKDSNVIIVLYEVQPER